MLHTIEFIKEHPNWEELLTQEPYYIRITHKGDLVMFQYIQGMSTPCEIVNECRGLILDSANDYKIVRYGFYRFYNYGEPGCADIDFNSVTTTEKIDGSLVMLYYYNGQWHWSTRGTFDAVDAPVGDTPYDFQHIIDRALFFETPEQEEKFYAQLDTNMTYVFELVSPESRVVICYPEPKLYFLMARNNETLAESFICDMAPKPIAYDVSTYEQIEQFVNEQNGARFEGVVVRDKNGNRAKIKNLTWLKLHHLHGNGHMNEEKCLRIVFDGEENEFISYFPEYRRMIEGYTSNFEYLLFLSFKLGKLPWDEIFPRKQFALLIQKTVKHHGYLAMLYKAYEHRSFEWFLSLDLTEYLRLFGDDVLVGG